MITKDTIQQKFDFAAKVYDNYASIQDLCSKNLVNLVGFERDLEIIADIGSGTGTTTLELMKNYPNAKYALFDLSSNMLEVAQQKIGNNMKIKYINCDVEKYDFSQTYDLAISNLCLQWFFDIEKFIGKIMRQTKCFAFSTLVQGSFAEFSHIFEQYGKKSPIVEHQTFSDLEAVCRSFGKNSTCISQTYTKKCRNAYEAGVYFRNIGASASDSKSNNISVLRRHKSEVALEYIVFFGIIK